TRAVRARWARSGMEGAGQWVGGALLSAGPSKVRHLIVEGRQIVRDGQVTTLDLGAVIAHQNMLARRLAEAM
ncbi:MAG: 8-oxoguanine deaminase, partial [Rhodobacterales bacterium]